MRQPFDRFQQAVEAFVEQRDDLLMVVPATDADAPLVAQVVGDVEQAHGTDVFLAFPAAFVAPQPYLDVLVERLRGQVALANKALEEEGRPPFPDLPAPLADPARPPAERLREAIAFARTLVPPEGGHRLVWALVPLEVRDRAAYLELVAALVPWRGVEAWMRGVRILVRDAPLTAPVAARYGEAPRLRLHPVDFGPAALEAGLQETAADEAQPEAQRMSSFLSLALLDYAHNRIGPAVEKLQALLGYYQHTGDRPMQAFVMSGMGDLNRRNGRLPEARHWYECALAPLAEAPAPVILFSVLKNLGQLTYEQREWATAEQYFGMAEEVATHARDAEGKAWALEWRGRAQEQQANYGGAVESWKAAATLSRGVGMDEPLRTNLELLAGVYRRGRMFTLLGEVEAELRSLQSPEAA